MRSTFRVYRSKATLLGRCYYSGSSKIGSTPVSANHLKDIFDSNEYWNTFNERPTNYDFLNRIADVSSSKSKSNVGLFNNPFLSSAANLRKFADETLDKARLLTDSMMKNQSDADMLNYIKELDRLSDMLCRVIDLCEYLRVAHPSKSFIEAAEYCHSIMFEHMNILNTSKPLFYKLQTVLTDEKYRSKLSEEEITVGKILFDDFKKSGIDMDDATGEKFVQLSSYISQAGQEFNNNISVPAVTSVKIGPEEFEDGDLDLRQFKSVSKGYDGSLNIPLYGHTPYQILRTCPNRLIRERVWIAVNSVPNDQLTLLTNVLRCRDVLSKLMNFSDYAQYTLHDKMAKAPANVMEFLNDSIKDLKPLVLKELRTLFKYFVKDTKSTMKQNVSDEELAATIKPWDREYLLTKHIMAQKSSQTEDISQYFSLGSVVSGLSELFDSIYGIKLVPQKLKKGEVWSNDVRKFDVMSESEGKVGIMYLDLLHRDGKTPQPAHYTIVCSRKIDPQELDSEDRFNLSIPLNKSVEVFQNETTGESYQLPIIAINCNYAPSNSTGIVFLTLDQVSTLFHEMGHAMHSMLGRTTFHNVSGTRCLSDFVELPSILLETFAKDERVLHRIGKHYATGKPVPIDVIKKYLSSDQILKNSETFGQFKMALLDQISHGSTGIDVHDEYFDIVKVYHQLESDLGLYVDDKSSWPGKFGHLFSYGAFYYSYMLDRAIAMKIWNKLFKEDPYSREAGEKFKNEILRWGGSRDPWLCLSKVLEDDTLAKGDVEAMKKISGIDENL